MNEKLRLSIDAFLYENIYSKLERTSILFKDKNISANMAIETVPTVLYAYLNVFFNAYEKGYKFNTLLFRDLFTEDRSVVIKRFKFNMSLLDMLLVQEYINIYNFNYNLNDFYKTDTYTEEMRQIQIEYKEKIWVNIINELSSLNNIFDCKVVYNSSQSLYSSFSREFTYNIIIYIIENYDEFKPILEKEVKKKLFEYRLKRNY